MDWNEEFTPFPGVPLDNSFQGPQGLRECKSWPSYDCMVRFFAESQQLRNTTRWENITAVECNRYYLDYPPYRYRSGRGGVIVVTQQPLKDRHVIPARLIQNHPRQEASYCLAKRVPFQSKLQVHIWFLIAVIFLNTIKISCMAFTLYDLSTYFDPTFIDIHIIL